MKGCKSLVALVALVGLGLWVWCCWILVWLVLQGWLCLAEGCKSEAILQFPLQGEAGSEYRQIVKGGTSGVLTLAISVNDLSLSLQYLHFSALLSFWAPEMVADKSPIRPRQQKRTKYIQLISAARYMHGIRCCPQLLCSIRLPWDRITYMSMYRWRCLEQYIHIIWIWRSWLEARVRKLVGWYLSYCQKKNRIEIQTEKAAHADTDDDDDDAPTEDENDDDDDDDDDEDEDEEEEEEDRNRDGKAVPALKPRTRGGIEPGPARGEGGRTQTVSRVGTLMLPVCLFLAKARATPASTSCFEMGKKKKSFNDLYLLSVWINLNVRNRSSNFWSTRFRPRKEKQASHNPVDGDAKLGQEDSEYFQWFFANMPNIFLQSAESIWAGWSWFKNGPKIAAIWSGSCRGSKKNCFFDLVFGDRRTKRKKKKKKPFARLQQSSSPKHGLLHSICHGIQKEYCPEKVANYCLVKDTKTKNDFTMDVHVNVCTYIYVYIYIYYIINHEPWKWFLSFWIQYVLTVSIGSLQLNLT